MKQLNSILMGCLLCALCSCGFLAKKRYQLAKKPNFNNSAAYLDDLDKRGLFDRNQLYYVDSVHYISFFTRFVAKDSTAIYVGALVDDSTWLRKSDWLLANGSCKGRLDGEIERILSMREISKDEIASGPSLQGQGLYKIANKQPYQGSKMKKQVILSYTYLFGTYYDELYKKIRQTVAQHDAELIVVSIDPVYRLHP